MATNRSLNEFIDPSPRTDEPDRSNESAGPTLVYAWDPVPTSCRRCGEPVQPRWFDGMDPCCTDCKSW